jgi:hypothetical protein
MFCCCKKVQIKYYGMAYFHLVFANRQLTDQVLHAALPQDAGFLLIFQRWRRQAGALFKPFRYKVLLSISNVPSHV